MRYGSRAQPASRRPRAASVRAPWGGWRSCASLRVRCSGGSSSCCRWTRIRRWEIYTGSRTATRGGSRSGSTCRTDRSRMSRRCGFGCARPPTVSIRSSLRSSGAWIGVCSFLNISGEHRRLEIGHIWIARKHQRTEALTEMAWLMLSRAFDELDCRRTEWRCNALNVASRRAAERLGFAFEGVHRQHIVDRGRNWDTAAFSMLDPEWPAVRRGLRAWLMTDLADRRPLTELRADAPAEAIDVRAARREDLPAIAAMLADDESGGRVRTRRRARRPTTGRGGRCRGAARRPSWLASAAGGCARRAR